MRRLDTTVSGRPFAEVYPTGAEFVAGHPWFKNHEPITIHGRRYVKYGPPRSLGPGDVVRTRREHGGVLMFAVRPDEEILYAPVSPACIFQPYYSGR